MAPWELSWSCQLSNRLMFRCHQVFLALRDGVDEVAVKVLKGKQDEKTTAAFAREVSILSAGASAGSCGPCKEVWNPSSYLDALLTGACGVTVKHTSILQYLGVCSVSGHTLLVRVSGCIVHHPQQHAHMLVTLPARALRAVLHHQSSTLHAI